MIHGAPSPTPLLTTRRIPTFFQKVAQRQAPTNKSWVYPVTSTNGNRTSMSIALFGDWGTGTPQSYSLLQQVRGMDIFVMIRLGPLQCIRDTDMRHACTLLSPTLRPLRPWQC